MAYTLESEEQDKIVLLDSVPIPAAGSTEPFVVANERQVAIVYRIAEIDFERYGPFGDEDEPFCLVQFTLSMAGFSFTAVAAFAVLDGNVRVGLQLPTWYVFVSFVAFLSSLNVESYIRACAMGHSHKRDRTDGVVDCLNQFRRNIRVDDRPRRMAFWRNCSHFRSNRLGCFVLPA